MTDGFGFDDRTADAAVGDTPTERVVAKLKKLNADPVRFDFGDEDVVRFVDRQWERVFGQGDAPRTTTFETFRPRVTRDDAILDGPVGAGAPNHPLDGFRAKKLLNRAAGFPFRPGEEDFGEVGPRVVGAIKRFQAERGLAPDGVIQPGGPTVDALGREALTNGGRRRTLLTADDFVPTKVPGPTLLTNAGPMSGTSTSKTTEVRSDGFNRDLLSFNNRFDKWRRAEQLKKTKRQVFNERPKTGSEAATRAVPTVRDEKLRQEFLRKNLRAKFPIVDDTKNVIGHKKAWYERHSVGRDAVKKYKHIIEEEAKRAGIHPDIVKTIIYLENARGYYDMIGFPYRVPSSIRPMNINPETWKGVGGINKKNAWNPRVNIRAGAILLKRILDRTKDDHFDENEIKGPDIRKIAAIYNFTGKERTGNDPTGYVARAAFVFRNKLWEREMP